MLPTPDLSHLGTSDYRHVYEPAEDSFLLLDALEADQAYLRDQVQPRLCVEVGSGSGVITAFLATQVLHSSEAQYLTTDINPHAVAATRQTCTRNGLDSHQLTSVQTDLLDGLIDRNDNTAAHYPQLDGQVDILLFNPPYVVTPSSEVGSQGIEAAWAGGIDGREVLDRFLPLVPQVLSPHGVFYLVTIEPNRPADILQHMDQCHGLIGHTVLKRKAGCEHLSILRFTRRTLTSDHVEECLAFAVTVARQAGSVIREAFYGRGLSSAPQAKGGNPSDLVTAADQQVEALVFDLIRTRYPNHQLIGEESTQGKKWRLTKAPTWIIDPIDGTSNFAHGFPFVAISLALAVEEQLVLGVVYNPILDQLYTARTGHGAWLNETTRLPLPSARARAPLPPISECLMAFEYGSDRSSPVLNSKLGTLHRLLAPCLGDSAVTGAQVHGVRSLGSGALNMCLVAQGALDAYWEIGSHLWDIAAGTVIVQEAGGLVVDGRGLYQNKRGLNEWTPDFDHLARKYLAIRPAHEGADRVEVGQPSSMHQTAQDLLSYIEDITVTRDGE
ncbi:hypothetical protein H4R35_004686 [Dimargaris xerosporica]|nr:hypothetical protein H4R35_004686 [Dimargaris xerosporica]